MHFSLVENALLLDPSRGRAIALQIAFFPGRDCAAAGPGPRGVRTPQYPRFGSVRRVPRKSSKLTIVSAPGSVGTPFYLRFRSVRRAPSIRSTRNLPNALWGPRFGTGKCRNALLSAFWVRASRPQHTGHPEPSERPLGSTFWRCEVSERLSIRVLAPCVASPERAPN